MPRGDRTGPNGVGSMSGRRMGFCVGNNVPGLQNYDSNLLGGRGFGFRHRNRRGGNQGVGNQDFNNGRALYPSQPTDKKALLEEQMNSLRKQLTDLENQFKNLA